MTKPEYTAIETHMKTHMQDSAHDMHHVYRVLNAALDIAKHETEVDMDVLIAACLLHDIGRKKQFTNPGTCHAIVGSEMAHEFLQSRSWPQQKALHVKDCISAHRYRGGNAPETTESKILFDADKLDVCGLIGIARTLIYQGQVATPLYELDDNGEIITEGGADDESAFFPEYHYKLKNVYTSFFTARAKEIAAQRQQAAIDFYDGLYAEIRQNYDSGMDYFM